MDLAVFTVMVAVLPVVLPSMDPACDTPNSDSKIIKQLIDACSKYLRWHISGVDWCVDFFAVMTEMIGIANPKYVTYHKNILWLLYYSTNNKYPEGMPARTNKSTSVLSTVSLTVASTSIFP
jgi:hypothetical protein